MRQTSGLSPEPHSALGGGGSGDGTPCLPLLSLFGARTQLVGSQVPGVEWQRGQGGGDEDAEMDLSWEEARGLALLQGAEGASLSAVWDSNLRSWCLKTIRQRPPSLPRPGPLHPGPRWAAVSKASAKTVGSLGRGLCRVGLCRGGPGVRHAEWKAGTSPATLLPRAV